MKIALDQKKYRKVIRGMWISIFAFALGIILILTMNLFIQHSISFKRILILVFIAFFLIQSILFLRHYSKLKHIKDCVIRYENGILDDFSKPYNKARSLKVENILSIWPRGTDQYQVVTSKKKKDFGALINQIRGKDIYLTSYVVDSKDLNELVTLIKQEMKSLKEIRK